jgi:Mn-dependent DtxR family transcriptional regulator
MAHANRFRLGMPGYVKILTTLRDCPMTTAQISQSLGINLNTTQKLLSWMRRLKLVHRDGWHKPVKHSRLICYWHFGGDGDVPPSDRPDEGRLVPSSPLMLLATTAEILREEPTSKADLADELSMHVESASRIIRLLKAAGLVHVGGWGTPPKGPLYPQWSWGSGVNVRRPPRKSPNIQRRRWYATHRAKMAHIELINATARPMCQEGSAA